MIDICNLSFFNYLDDLFFIIDFKGKIIEGNTSVSEKLPYDNVIGKNILEIIPNIEITNFFNDSYISKRTLIKTRIGDRFFTVKSLTMKMKCTNTDYILIIAKEEDIETKYKNIFDSSIQGIFQSTMDGKYLTVNKAFASLCGYDCPEQMTKSITNIGEDLYAYPEDREKFKNLMLKDGQVKDLEGLILKKNGDKVLVSCSSVAIKDDNGNILYIEGIIEDITEKRETFNNYRSLLNAIPDMMARIRYDGHIIGIKEGEGIYSDEGQSTGFIGMNIKDLPFGDSVINDFENIIKKVITDGNPIEYSYSINILNDNRYYHSRTVKKDDNEAVVIIRDITEETLVSKDLRNSKDFTDNLMNTANVMIVGLDINGNVNIFNDSAESLTGYKKIEVLGKNWFNELSILLKRDALILNDVFTSLIGEDVTHNIVENPIVTKDGEIKYILWRNNEVRENDKIVGTISFGLDISDRKKVEEELIEAKNKAEKSDKMKLEFLANMSHDLRTPMNAIIGFSDLLKANNISKSDRNDYINTIINNGKFLMALIDDIIDISKIDAGNLKIENKDFELNKLLEELRLSYSKQTKDKNLEIIIDEDVNKNIIINSDKYRLRQILMNLIGNAVKFTNDGYIKFGYKIINHRQLEIYVEDTGPGIERQYQRLIFERFKQIGTNNKFKGAGLGLSITKSLVELLGFKEIKLISELDRGSKFYFYVPYTIKHYNYINEIKETKKNKKLNFLGKNILIVEDNDDSRHIMKSYLYPTNANVFELSDGRNILETIKNENIDLVLLDIGLPGKNGYELLQDIRKINDRLPVIIESALAMPDQKSLAFEMGCDDFISKPFNREDFLNKIDNLI